MSNKLKEFNINDFEVGQNLFIEASAGTGKTYTIQQLTAKMVEEGISLDKILIVTYTDKAAGELRDRIRQKLEECAAISSEQCYKTALQNINNAPIFTIHSFCKNTIEAFSYDSNAVVNMEVVDDGEVANLIDLLIRDVLVKRSDFLEILEGDQSFNFEELKRNCIRAVLEYNRVDNLELDAFDAEINSTEDLCHLVESFNKNLNILRNIKEPSIVNNSVFSETLAKIENWHRPDDFFKNWGEAKKNKLISLFEKKSENAEIIKSIEYFFSLKGKLPSAFLQTKAETFIMKNVEEIAARWEEYKKENKLQSYDNMIKTVHNEVCLKERSSLREKLKNTYKYAIIDEFQDTNQRQWDIFKTLFLDNFSEKTQNNIIVVGDPKQSIYAFQGADLEVYKKAIKEIGSENGRKLSVNNRSSDILITGCNEIFAQDFFEGEGDFSKSECPPAERKILPARLNGEITQPLWISNEVDPDDFSKFAVLKILECCQKNAEGKTALQVYDKKLKAMRNVAFSDFAVLGRTRSELVYMEEIMKSVGVPYTRYKDTKLFSGIEAFNWIALLKAINAPDFSGYNSKYLNTVLVSDFFRINYYEVNKDAYSDPTKSPMKEILYWKMLASKKRWSELQENIYSYTEIDKYWNVPSKLQSLAKLRQIGSYIFDFLYNHNASLESAIKHLEGLSINEEDVDETDANLIAKGCDFHTVKIMTSHAAKGLAFPVVIAIGGLKGVWSAVPGPFLYRNGDGKALSFSDFAKSSKIKEDTEEYRRLMYVAYTRAESLMILPRYKVNKKTTGFDFLYSALKRIAENEYDNKENIVRLEECEYNQWDTEKVEKEFKKVLEDLRELGNGSNNQSEVTNKQIAELQSNIHNLRLYKHSYSSINMKKKAIENLSGARSFDEEAFQIEGRFNKEEVIIEPEKDEPKSKIKNIELNFKEGIVLACNKYETAEIEKLPDYPKGSKLGNAIHSVFEKINFSKFGGLAAENIAAKNTFGCGIIEESFEVQSLSVKNNVDWVPFTAKMIWNTLNAELPEIQGNSAKETYFSLKDLTEENKKTEVEFYLDIKKADWVNRFCKGYIDLLLVRRDKSGRDYYSIIDWKSDSLDNSAYGSKEKLAEKVEKEYALQCVLYSYSLIKWLKMFYRELTEEEIFQNHFGGIYYVFVRGCKAGTSNGIYAQTWKNFEALEKSYKNIVKLMEL